MNKTTERLNEAMRLRGMRQIDILNAWDEPDLKLSSGQLAGYCTGYRNPKAAMVYALARLLQVNPAWLLGADVPMQENTPANQIAGIVHKLRSDAEFCQLVDDECKLTRSQLSAVRVVVSSLLGNDDSKQ